MHACCTYTSLRKAIHLMSSVTQMRAFAELHGQSTAAVLLGGDFNSLWRKYKTDAYDEVGPPQKCLLSLV